MNIVLLYTFYIQDHLYQIALKTNMSNTYITFTQRTVIRILHDQVLPNEERYNLPHCIITLHTITKINNQRIAPFLLHSNIHIRRACQTP